MIELIQTEVVTVPAGQSIPFNALTTKNGCTEYHRAGSSNVRLIKSGKYLVTFSGNIAVPAGETVGEISLGILADNGILAGSAMRATPAAAGEYSNVSTQHYVDVPQCCGTTCCVDISVQNLASIPLLVDNANISAVRVA